MPFTGLVVGDPGASDRAIMAWASENGYVVFTPYHDAAGAYFNHYGSTNRLDPIATPAPGNSKT